MTPDEIEEKMADMRKGLHDLKKQLNLISSRANNGFVNVESKLMDLIHGFSDFQIDVMEGQEEDEKP